MIHIFVEYENIKRIDPAVFVLEGGNVYAPAWPAESDAQCRTCGASDAHGTHPRFALDVPL